MRVFVPRERNPGETRVALVPEGVKKLTKSGFSIVIEKGAGDAAHFIDSSYEEAGATLVSDPLEGYNTADVVLKVSPLSEISGKAEVELLNEGATVIGFMAPYAQLDMVRRLAERNISSLSMELVPRISRAQNMDALSSQASLAGYKAVLLAAAQLDKYFPLLMTAAGTIQPARVVILGGGVAGLQALATARRLGAIVEVSDIRPEVQEQIESLGGKFIDLPLEEVEQGSGGYAKQVTPEFLKKQQAIVADRLAEADVAISTALVPGRPAPKLITTEMVQRMRPGAVIVDMAVAQGGNCELSKAGETVEAHGVTIIGPDNLPASVPADASTMYSRNLVALITHLSKKESDIKFDLEDEITQGTLLTYGGEVIHKPTRKALGLPEVAETAGTENGVAAENSPTANGAQSAAQSETTPDEDKTQSKTESDSATADSSESASQAVSGVREGEPS